MISVNPSWKTTRGDLKPGEFCGFWRSNGLVVGFTAEPKRDGHPPSCLVLHAPTAANLVGMYISRFQISDGLLQLRDVEVRFSADDVQYGSPDGIPSGSLILGETGYAFFVRTDDLNEFGVYLNTGEVGPTDLYRSFWTPRWKLMHVGTDAAAKPVFEFGG